MELPSSLRTIRAGSIGDEIVFQTKHAGLGIQSLAVEMEHQRLLEVRDRLDSVLDNRNYRHDALERTTVECYYSPVDKPEYHRQSQLYASDARSI